MSSPSSPATSSAASRAKVVPKTKKKPPPPSPSPATSERSPASFLLSAQAQAISSDSEGSLDDIVFDNTGALRFSFLFFPLLQTLLISSFFFV
jgi:hypothetical protein